MALINEKAMDFNGMELRCDQVTATTSLTVAGNTVTGTEFGAVDGVTAGTVLASKAVIVDANKDIATFRHVTLSGNLVVGATTVSETDIAKIDAITNGTQAAGKAVVTDANVNSGISKVTELHIGASGSETQVVATALEINRAADLSTRLVAAGASLAVTVAAHDGKTILLDTAGGSTCTLPVAAATGARIRFVVTTRPSGGSHIIKVGNASDFIAGQINLLDLDLSAQAAFQGDGAADDTITINNTTTGGAVGDSVVLEDTKANVWTVISGFLTVPAGSNVADPFSATV